MYDRQKYCDNCGQAIDWENWKWKYIIREKREQCLIEMSEVRLEWWRMRLINADNISFYCNYEGDCTGDINDCKKCGNYICNFRDIQEQPTAYDVDEEDVCEWKQTSTARYKTKCGYKLEEYFDTKACYCKQCGKKIKVVNNNK